MQPATQGIIAAAADFLWSAELASSIEQFTTNHVELFSAEAQLQSDGGNHLYGCWIGFQDVGMEGAFTWLDGSSVDYVDFAPGEPNDSHAGENAGSGQAGRETEDAVEMDFRRNIGRLGEWNDAQSDEGYEQFPICGKMAMLSRFARCPSR